MDDDDDVFTFFPLSTLLCVVREGKNGIKWDDEKGGEWNNYHIHIFLSFAATFHFVVVLISAI